jgi:hypothetical protein
METAGKVVLAIAMLFSTISFGLERVVCRTESYSQDGVLMMEEVAGDEWLNGQVTLAGSKLLDHFASELTTLKANCSSHHERGVTHRFCTVPAHIDLGTLDLQIGGRQGPAIFGASDFGGLKIRGMLAGYATGKDWWFNHCSQ